jgi:hypothetical protein
VLVTSNTTGASDVSNDNAPGGGGGGGIATTGTTSGTGNVTISGSTVDNNTASGGSGGGISTQGGKVLVTADSNSLGSTVNNNFANNNGGGISTTGPSANVTISGSTVDFNTTGLGDGGISTLGGEVFVLFNSLSGASDVSNNTAAGNGGGIATNSTVGGQVTVSGSTVNNNTAGDNGGGISTTAASASVLVTAFNSVGSTVNGNFAGTNGNPANGNGGGVSTCDAHVTISGSTMDNNTASGANGGGGISTALPDGSAAGDVVVIAQGTLLSHVDNNHATAGAPDNTSNGVAGSLGGGGILGGNVTVAGGSTMDNNKTKGLLGGGGILTIGGFPDNTGGSVTLDDGHVDDNQARATDGFSNTCAPGFTPTTQGGGGINATGPISISNGSTVNCNLTLGFFGGGGILYSGPGATTITITDSQISANTALGNGGGLNTGIPGTSLPNVVTIDGDTITFNQSLAGKGGGIFNGNGSLLTVSNSTIAGNFASLGGSQIFGPFTDGGGNNFSSPGTMPMCMNPVITLRPTFLLNRSFFLGGHTVLTFVLVNRTGATIPAGTTFVFPGACQVLATLTKSIPPGGRLVLNISFMSKIKPTTIHPLTVIFPLDP